MPQELIEFLENSNISDSLNKIAMDDNKITEDEKTLINNFTQNIESYVSLLKDSLEDGVIDGKEKFELFKTRMKIMVNVVEKACDDEVISDDEDKLLKSIRQIMSLVEEFENKL